MMQRLAWHCQSPHAGVFGKSRIDPAGGSNENVAVGFLPSLRPDPKIVLLGACLVLPGTANISAADYRVDHIEVFDDRYVNIHFDTVPNRTYALQYRSTLHFTNAPGTPTTGWSNLFVAPAQPFQNHFVVSDSRTNQQRYYRLRVTP